MTAKMTLAELSRWFWDAIRKIRDPDESGYLGIISTTGLPGTAESDGYIYDVPFHPGYTYARIQHGSSFEIAEVIVIGTGHNYYTKVGFYRIGGALIATSVNAASAVAGSGADVGTSTIAEHTHDFTVAADSGSDQTITTSTPSGATAGDTLTLAGAEGVKTAATTDKVTSKLDISGLTEDTSPDSANDYVATYDDSASLHKKVKLSNLGGSSSASLPDYTHILPVTATSGSQPIRLFAVSRDIADARLMTNYDFDTDTPTWVDRSSGLSSVVLTGAFDLFQPKRFWATTDDATFVTCPDIEAGTPWTVAYDYSSTLYCLNKVLVHPLMDGWVMGVGGDNPVVVTFDRFETTPSIVETDGGALSDHNTPYSRNQDADICWWDSGHVYAMQWLSGATYLFKLYKTTDGGLTWSSVNTSVLSPDHFDGFEFVIPPLRSDGSENKDDSSLEMHLYFASKGSSTPRQMARYTSTDAGITWTQTYLSTQNSGTDNPYGMMLGRAVYPFPHDGQIYSHVEMNNAGSIADQRPQVIQTSNDYSTSSASSRFDSSQQLAQKLDGWAQDENALVASWGDGDGDTNGGLKFTLDGGINWLGDIPPAWGSNRSVAFAGFPAYTPDCCNNVGTYTTDTVDTTDATATMVETIPTVSDTVYTISAIVTARCTGGTGGHSGDGAGYRLFATFRNVSGTVTQIGSTDKVAQEDISGWDADFAISGTDIQITVTGGSTDDVSWQSSYHKESV